MKRWWILFAMVPLLLGNAMLYAQPGMPSRTTSPAPSSQTSDPNVGQKITEQFKISTLQDWMNAARNDSLFSALTALFNRVPKTTGEFKKDPDKLLLLYAASVFRVDEYMSIPILEARFDSLVQAGQWKEAYDLAQEILCISPITPYILSETIKLKQQFDPEATNELSSLRNRLKLGLQTIEYLGNGSRRIPFVVMNMEDEFLYLSEVLMIDSLEAFEWETNTPPDVYINKVALMEEDAQYLGKDTLWFNVSGPMRRLDRMMELALEQMVNEIEPSDTTQQNGYLKKSLPIRNLPFGPPPITPQRDSLTPPQKTETPPSTRLSLIQWSTEGTVGTDDPTTAWNFPDSKVQIVSRLSITLCLIVPKHTSISQNVREFHTQLRSEIPFQQARSCTNTV